MKMKYRFAATLLLLATLVSCAPSDEPTVTDNPSALPSPSAAAVPTTVSDFDYRRYTNPQCAYYPEWAQPHSVYKYDKQEGESVQGKFSLGGYLTKEQLAKDPTKMEHFMDYEYMTPATMYTMISYDEDGHIMLDSLIYRYLDGSYHKEPPTDEEKPQPYAPPKDPSPPFTSSPIAVLPRSEDDIKLSYDEYFSIPRYVEPYYNTPRDSTYKKLYETTPEIEEMLAPYDIISLVHGNDVVLFFMTDEYDIYRIHLPSGTLDYICSAAYDYEKALECYGHYIMEDEWINARDGRPPWKEPETRPYEVWVKEADLTDIIEEGKEKLIRELPLSGTFQILSNNDVRFIVPPNDDYVMWEYISPYTDEGWFSNGSGDRWFIGDYVVYSAALEKYGAPERVNLPSDEWNTHTWQRRNRMTLEEFVEYFGGYPPYSMI